MSNRRSRPGSPVNRKGIAIGSAVGSGRTLTTLKLRREYGFFPRACNPAAGWEKGKVERAIGHIRQNFWPLHEFTDLHDVNRQARQWLSEVANQRQHRETRERPMDRFQPAALKPSRLAFATDGLPSNRFPEDSIRDAASSYLPSAS